MRGTKNGNNNVNVSTRKVEGARIVACESRKLAGRRAVEGERRKGVVVGECEGGRSVVIDECGRTSGEIGGGAWCGQVRKGMALGADIHM